MEGSPIWSSGRPKSVHQDIRPDKANVALAGHTLFCVPGRPHPLGLRPCKASPLDSIYPAPPSVPWLHCQLAQVQLVALPGFLVSGYYMGLSLPFLLFAERQSQGYPQERLKAFEAFLLLTSLACRSRRKAFFRPLLFRMGRPFLFLSAKPPVFAATSGNQLDQTTANRTAPCPPQTRTSGLERIPSSMEQSQSSATIPFSVYYDRRFAAGRRYSRLGSKRRQLDAKPRFSSLFFEKAAKLHKQPKGVADNQPGDESDCASGSNGSNHHRLFMRSVVPEQIEKPLQGLAKDSKRPQDLVPTQPGPSPSDVAPASSSRSGRQAVPSNHRYFNVLPQPVSGISLLSSAGVSASSRLYGNG